MNFFSECLNEDSPTPCCVLADAWGVHQVMVRFVRDNPSMAFSYVIEYLRKKHPIPSFHRIAYLWESATRSNAPRLSQRA